MKALWLWVLSIIILGLTPVFQLKAEVVDNQQLTLVPTRAVEPLQILVSSNGEDGWFSGEILSRRPLYASVLQFTLLNQEEGVAWRDTLKLPLQAQRIMPFYFPAIGADEPLFLSVQAYDDFGNTVGSGHKYVTLQVESSNITVSNTEAHLNDKGEINISLFTENGALRQGYIPQVKVYQGLEHFGDLLETTEQEVVILDPKQRQQLSFDQSFPFPPGVYEVVVTLLDAGTREPLSASFYQQIYRSGDFFKVIDLKSYYTATDHSKARLELSGLSTVVLTEPVQIQVRLQHQQNIFLDKTFNLALQPGYFTKYIELNLPDYVERLSGNATFSLKGKKIQSIDFKSEEMSEEALALAKPETPEPKKLGPIVLKKGDRWVFSSRQVWGVVVACTLMLLLIVVLSWARNRWLSLLILALGGTGTLVGTVQALTVGRDVFPMVEWSNPIPEMSMVFNPSSQKGFQWLPVKGRVFNYLTQTALLKDEAFDRVRFNLVSPTNRRYQYQLDESLLKEDSSLYANPRSGDYYFVLDLGHLVGAPVIGRDTTLVWEEGEWGLQLIFPYQQKNEDLLYLATPLEEFGRFTVDEQPPLWKWQLQNESGEFLTESDFTNKPITVSLQCQDRGSACVNAQQSFEIKGNFCSDALKCNVDAARDFELCDTAGNCHTEAITIRGYDPVPPSVESFLVGASTAVEANEIMPLSLRYTDPNKVEEKDWVEDFDAALCGEGNPYFRLESDSWTCTERSQTCVLVSERNVWRGASFDGKCEPLCPEGYQFTNGSCQIVCGEGAFTEDRLCLPFNLKIDEA